MNEPAIKQCSGWSYFRQPTGLMEVAQLTVFILIGGCFIRDSIYVLLYSYGFYGSFIGWNPLQTPRYYLILLLLAKRGRERGGEYRQTFELQPLSTDRLPRPECEANYYLFSSVGMGMGDLRTAIFQGTTCHKEIKYMEGR